MYSVTDNLQSRRTVVLSGPMRKAHRYNSHCIDPDRTHLGRLHINCRPGHLVLRVQGSSSKVESRSFKDSSLEDSRDRGEHSYCPGESLKAFQQLPRPSRCHRENAEFRVSTVWTSRRSQYLRVYQRYGLVGDADWSSSRYLQNGIGIVGVRREQ